MYRTYRCILGALLLLWLFGLTSASLGLASNSIDLIAIEKQQDADMAFFEMTEENLAASQSAEWYEDWVRDMIEKHLDEYNAKGEWPLFADRFFKNRNFQCGTGFAVCTEVPSIRELLQMYPKASQRDTVRRIYFTSKKMDLLHTEVKAMRVHTIHIHIHILEKQDTRIG